MANEARTFRQLEKTMDIRKLGKFAKAVTENYATKDYEYTQKISAEDNHLTVKAHRELMDFAISYNYVSLEIAEMVYNKAKNNQRKYGNNAGSNSFLHHRGIIKQRNHNLALTYSRAEINEKATDIANTDKPLSYFQFKYGMESVGVLKEVLERAIVENIVSDETMKKIISRSIKGNTNPRVDVEGYFLSLRNKREKDKQASSQN